MQCSEGLRARRRPPQPVLKSRHDQVELRQKSATAKNVSRISPRIKLSFPMTRICNVVVLALLSILMVPAAFAQSASATVVAGSDYCREIHFPGGWKPTKRMQKAQQNHFARFLFGSLYEFRKTSADSQEYLVAAVDQIGAHRDCSPNKFWANLRSGKVRSATQGEWESSQPVQQTSYIKGRFDEPKTNDGVLLHERLFRKSGPQWPIPGEHARISPD